jgi:hypothetical protein
MYKYACLLFMHRVKPRMLESLGYGNTITHQHLKTGRLLPKIDSTHNPEPESR